jgi:hypothetical protein
VSPSVCLVTRAEMRSRGASTVSDGEELQPPSEANASSKTVQRE